MPEIAQRQAAPSGGPASGVERTTPEPSTVSSVSEALAPLAWATRACPSESAEIAATPSGASWCEYTRAEPVGSSFSTLPE